MVQRRVSYIIIYYKKLKATKRTSWIEAFYNTLISDVWEWVLSKIMDQSLDDLWSGGQRSKLLCINYIRYELDRRLLLVQSEEIDIYAPGGFGPRNHSKWKAADPRLNRAVTIVGDLWLSYIRITRQYFYIHSSLHRIHRYRHEIL
jgi:hypothetical protein